MSWGGEEAWRYSETGTNPVLDDTTLARETAQTLAEVEATGVDQHDLREPNMVWNAKLQLVLLIDFEYAKVVAAPAAKEVKGQQVLIQNESIFS